MEVIPGWDMERREKSQTELESMVDLVKLNGPWIPINA